MLNIFINRDHMFFVTSYQKAPKSTQLHSRVPQSRFLPTVSMLAT